MELAIPRDRKEDAILEYYEEHNNADDEHNGLPVHENRW